MTPQWYERFDGTLKGPGFAAFTNPYTGAVSTELANGGMAGIPLYPTIYQDITPWDLQTLMNREMYGYDPLQEEVWKRAGEVASQRIASGLSPFWTPADGASGTYWDLLQRDKSWWENTQ